jgi:hypothetical protein
MRASGFCWSVVVRLVACLAVLAGCGGGGGAGADAAKPRAADPVAPIVMTLAAQTTSATEETVSGTVNPNGSETQFWFEWAADETFAEADATALGTLAASSAVSPVSATLGGLAKAQHLHYRLVARNAAGTVQADGRSCNHYASVLFATSATGTGDLGSWADAGGKTGLAAGDAICQTLADRAGIPGPVRAWLSDQTVAARDRLAHSAEAYVRVDGVRVASSWSDLMPAACVGGAACVDATISVDERGAAVPLAMPGASTYTETRWDGSGASVPFGTHACLNWTSAAPTEKAGGGYTWQTNYQWTESGAGGCSFARRLYCVQQRLDLPQDLFDTGCAGPIGWSWHVSACSNGLYQDPECAYVCCGFYAPTGNCGTTKQLPVSFNGYTVNTCSYNTGVYMMSVTHAGHDFTVHCEVD